MGAGESSMALESEFSKSNPSSQQHPFPEHLFDLKFAAKQLEKNAQKCEKEEKVEKDKLTNAIKVKLANQKRC